MRAPGQNLLICDRSSVRLGAGPIAKLALAALLLAAASAAAAAQDQPRSTRDYPNQTVKIVVPFAAGGRVDVVARIVVPKLGEELDQTVIIENRGGAGGALGAAAVAQAPADGYTLLLGTDSTHGTNPNVYAHLPYDPVRDFAPVALISSSPLLLVVPPTLPAKSVADLIALARSRPSTLAFGSYGTGSINHLGAELFNSMAKITANHVPYRGSAPAMTDLMGGRIDYMFNGVSTALGYIQSNTVRTLAAGGLERTPILPDVPTIAEAGLPGYSATVWYGLFAPAGTPASIVELLNHKMNRVLASPQVKEAFAKLGVDALGGRSDALAAKVQSEMQKWAAIIRENNIRLDR